MGFRNLVHKISLASYRMTDRLFKRTFSVDIFNHIHQAKQVLVCLPSAERDFSIAQEYFTKIGKVFPEATLSLLLQEGLDLIEPTAIPHKIIVLSAEHQSAIGLPNKALQKTIKNGKYDVAVDLNAEFLFTVTFLCRVSKSPLRICFSHPKKDPFFNFIIRTDTNLPLERRYDTLMQYLQAGSSTTQSMTQE